MVMKTLFPLEEFIEQKKEQERTYTLISCPIAGKPFAHTFTGIKQVVRAFRQLYTEDDQQYMFIVNGKLGQLTSTKKGFSLSFEKEVIQIPLKAKVKDIVGGWLGD